MSQCLSLFLSISFSSQSDNIYVYATYCRGSLIGHPVENIRIVLTDGASHQVDSSELAFKLAAIYAFRQVSHIIVLKASPRRRLGVHAPSTDLRLARLGARLARLGVQPPHLARRPPYRLENNGHILDMDNAVSSELLGHECEVFYNICFSFSVLHCCQTYNIRTCCEG